jgi:acetyl esterase/lipase
VQAVVDWYGPTDPSPFTGPVGAGDLPSTYIRAGQRLPPFRIAHGSADCTVPVEESRRLYRALTAAGDPATLSILSGAYHEDPAFMRTELVPTLTFLDDSLDHSVDHSLGTAAPAH